MVKTKPQLHAIVKRLVAQLEEKSIFVQKLILFGSYVTGKAEEYSDMDIAVISDSFRGKGILKRQELLGEALYSRGEPIEALGYTVSEYRNIKPASFLSEIISSGKVIYSKN